MFGRPCMTCGMTTAFTHAAHLQLRGRHQTQPLGLLAFMTPVEPCRHPPRRPHCPPRQNHPPHAQTQTALARRHSPDRGVDLQTRCHASRVMAGKQTQRFIGQILNMKRIFLFEAADVRKRRDLQLRLGVSECTEVSFVYVRSLE